MIVASPAHRGVLFLLAYCCCCCAVPTPAAASSIPWTPKCATHVVVPPHVSELPPYAFADCASLESAELPPTLTVIGESAFQNCGALQTLGLPAGLLEIGKSSFSGCLRLRVVSNASSLTTIGDDAFNGCASLERFGVPPTSSSSDNVTLTGQAAAAIRVPASVSHLGDRAFSGCVAARGVVEFIDGPAAVHEIGDYVFSGCSNLTTVVLPRHLTRIGNGAFAGCSSLETIDIPDMVTEIGRNAFYSTLKLAQLRLPSALTSLGKGGGVSGMVFAASGLVSVDVPPGVTTITGGTFSFCTNLTSVVLHGNVVEIKLQAFMQTPKLRSLVFANASALKSIGVSAFEMSALPRDVVPESLTEFGNWFGDVCSNARTEMSVDSRFTSLGFEALWGCGLVRTLHLPSSITRIAAYALSSMGALETIKLPKHVTRIEQNTFEYCYALRSVELGPNVTFIGDSAFRFNVNLSSINIPDSVAHIGAGAFQGCRSLTNISLPPLLATLGVAAFMGCSSLTSMVLPTAVRDVPLNLCSGCQRLSSLSLGDAVATLGETAFAGCHNLSITNVVLPATLWSIGHAAFAGTMGGGGNWTPPPQVRVFNAWFGTCPSSAHFVVPSRYTHIGAKVFQQCTDLVRVTLPPQLASIGELAFDSSGINSIVFPDSMNSMGSLAFRFTRNLTSVVLPAALTSIPPGAFYDSGVRTMTWAASSQPIRLCNISDLAFSGASRLTTLAFPPSLRRIGASAFEGTRLTDIVLPAGCELAAEVFGGCGSLQRVRFEYGGGGSDDTNNVESPPVAFGMENNVEAVEGKLRTQLTRIPLLPPTKLLEYVFGDCGNLTSVVLPVPLSPSCVVGGVNSAFLNDDRVVCTRSCPEGFASSPNPVTGPLGCRPDIVNALTCVRDAWQ